MYSSENVKWVKNVLRNKGKSGWAYENEECGKEWFLHFPNQFRGSVLKASVGDIILLFQRPKFINRIRNDKVHLTHLVTPVDSKEYPDRKNSGWEWARKVSLIAKANPIDSIPNVGYFNFYKPNRGQTHPIKNLQGTKDFSEIKAKELIWNLFSSNLCIDNSDGFVKSEIPLDYIEEVEGDRTLVQHVIQERRNRNSRIVKRAKDNALKRNNGRLSCEICKFDFYLEFGEHGKEFIECHHKIFIALGERITREEDLAMVCSNCHRMLHRKNKIGKYYSVEELTKVKTKTALTR